MPGWRGGRPLKAWTYVGAYGPDVMLCAARARVGPVPVAWWAVWDRDSGRMLARTARGRGGVEVDARRLVVAGRRVRLQLEIDDGEPIEVVSPHGKEYVWTRKRGGVRARGWLELDGERRPLDLRAIVDESAGYHARRTSWRWSAGVGVAASGAAVAWNLVDGIHDAAEASERTVWVDGRPHEVGPVAFAADLSSVAPIASSGDARPTRATSPRSAGCASPPRPSARGARTYSCCGRSTSSRSARSRASCRSPGGCGRGGA